MIKPSTLSEAVERTVALKMRAVDLLIKELVEPIADVGSPEAVIKKPFERWTPADMTIATKIYGTKEPSPLSELIFRKKYKEVQELEAEEKL